MTLNETMVALNMKMPSSGEKKHIPNKKPQYADVFYASNTNVRQSLDIYLPNDAVGAVPVIVYVHGGAWTVGSKADVSCSDYDVHVLADNLIKNGYAVAAVNYRLMPDYRYPAQTDDVIAAVKYLHDHAAEYGIDGGKMAIMGESAGGFLAEYAAVMLGAEQLRACVAFYSPSDLSILDKQNRKEHGGNDVNFMDIINSAMGGIMPEGQKMEEILLGYRIGTDEFELKAKEVSPAHLVGPETPPVLLLHGNGDKVIAYGQSVRFIDSLKSANIPCKLVTVAGANHMDPLFFNSPIYSEIILDFLKQYI